MVRILGVLLLISFFFVNANAQNSYLPSDDRAYHLMERLETKSGSFSNHLFLSDKNITRSDVYDFLSGFKTEGYYSGKTIVDNYLIFETLSENGEWKMPGSDGANISRVSLGPFYRRRPDMVHLNKPGFFWVLNPVLGLQATSEQKPEQEFLWGTTAGLETRGRIADFLGFSFSATHNSTQPVRYQEQYINKWDAIPGAGSYRKTTKGYQYFLFEGNLNTTLIKDHISLDVGYGKHFLGDGIRSLFISENAGSQLYVGINTKIWRLNYQNLYLRLEPNHFSREPQERGNKYATVHYLSANIRPWLNIGLFESVTFTRRGGYEIAYMNPIIFYRAVERALGSPDKVSIGLNAKAIVAHRFNFYGQLLINEFSGKEFFSDKGYWANKWGAQLGMKYYDIFNLPNVDFQGELNLVRPYTYSHRNNPGGLATENFSSGNQPLAHPFGAGFQEILGRISYRPLPRLNIEAIAMLYRQGTDTGNANFGNDIFKSYTTRASTYGVRFINGPQANCMFYRLNVSYELKPRLFLFAQGAYRKYWYSRDIAPEQTDLYFTAGVRLNLNRSLRHLF